MRPTQRCVFFFNRQALEWPQESVPNYDGFVSELVEYLFNELKGSIAGMSLMSEVSAQSPTARNIGAVLQASDRLFYIDVNDRNHPR